MDVDLVAAFIDRRVLLLQDRPHWMCGLQGRLDPCRLTTDELPLAHVATRVNLITNFKLGSTT